MSHNRAFWKAFHSLVHPLSLIAILLLLFNDHWLRYAHPSWLTGKLGDFTWLVFAPFIAGLLFAWLIPRRLDRQPQWVGILSIGFIGVWFATAKTIPFVHMLTTETLYAIVGWEGQLRLDPTDLLTLPALLISWMIWRQARDSKVSLKPLAYVAFGLGILGTLASDTSYTYDVGITRLCAGDDAIYTEAVGWNYTLYYSRNGGLFWQSHIGTLDDADLLNCFNRQLSMTELVVNDELSLRWTPDVAIEVSTDGGNTWQVENDLPELEQDIRIQYVEYKSRWTDHIVDYYASPTSAVYDEATGNVIFAMSHHGVLVREPDGQYTWVAVGDDYGLQDLNNWQYASYALFLELWLALATMFLVITTSTLYIRRVTRQKLPLIISWVGYATILLILIVERNYDVTMEGRGAAAALSLLMLIFFGIPFSIGAVWDIARNFRSVALNITLAAVGNGALFIFPFILWTQGRIPRYVFAYGMSMMLTGLGLYATWIYLKRILPTLEPEKEKRDAIEKAKAEEV